MSRASTSLVARFERKTWIAGTSPAMTKNEHQPPRLIGNRSASKWRPKKQAERIGLRELSAPGAGSGAGYCAAASTKEPVSGASGKSGEDIGCDPGDFLDLGFRPHAFDRIRPGKGRRGTFKPASWAAGAEKCPNETRELTSTEMPNSSFNSLTSARVEPFSPGSIFSSGLQ